MLNLPKGTVHLDLAHTTYIVFFRLQCHLELRLPYEKVLLILFNAYWCFIWSPLQYNLHTFEAFVHWFLYITSHKMPCQSGSTFAKFSFIALGRHLTNWCYFKIQFWAPSMPDDSIIYSIYFIWTCSRPINWLKFA